ncbi:MAG: hypothetical protein J6E38_02340 [Clostridia bacterium]|nr:hypothetical protein [Clostridia bacterium]
MAMRLCDSRLSTSPEAMLERISALETMPRSVSSPASAPVTPKAETKPETEAPKQQEAPPFDDAPPFDFDDVPPPVDAPPAFSEPSLPKPLGSDLPKAKPADDMPEMIAYGDILEEIKSQNMILYSMLTDSRGYLDNDVMTVKVNPMALFMIDSDNAMKQVVVDCASKILGYPVTLNLVEDGGDNKKKSNDDFPMF